MFRKLAIATASLLVALALLIGPAAQTASAMDYSLPYGSADCGTLAGPILPNELTYYFFAYRINGGNWTYSQNWMATFRTNNWEFAGGGWQYRQVNMFMTPDLRPGTSVDRWAYVHRASFQGWVNLGSCTQGGVVF